MGSAADAAQAADAAADQAIRAYCAGTNGHLEHVGKAQALRCIVTYADAGKACTDGSQCLGKRCVGDFEDKAAPNPATGTCTATNNPFGCNTVVEAGVARTLCID